MATYDQKTGPLNVDSHRLLLTFHPRRRRSVYHRLAPPTADLSPPQTSLSLPSTRTAYCWPFTPADVAQPTIDSHRLLLTFHPRRRRSAYHRLAPPTADLSPPQTSLSLPSTRTAYCWPFTPADVAQPTIDSHRLLLTFHPRRRRSAYHRLAPPTADLSPPQTSLSLPSTRTAYCWPFIPADVAQPTIDSHRLLLTFHPRRRRSAYHRLATPTADLSPPQTSLSLPSTRTAYCWPFTPADVAQPTIDSHRLLLTFHPRRRRSAYHRLAPPTADLSPPQTSLSLPSTRTAYCWPFTPADVAQPTIDSHRLLLTFHPRRRRSAYHRLTPPTADLSPLQTLLSLPSTHTAYCWPFTPADVAQPTMDADFFWNPNTGIDIPGRHIQYVRQRTIRTPAYNTYASVQVRGTNAVVLSAKWFSRKLTLSKSITRRRLLPATYRRRPPSRLVA